VSQRLAELLYVVSLLEEKPRVLRMGKPRSSQGQPNASRAHSKVNGMLPDFIVIGAQKSASTFLQVGLADHPDVFMPKGEIPFFESPDYENHALRDLKDLFEGRTERRLGFKRPNYLGKPEVPERIARDLPHVRLMAVLRDPVDRALSAYFHYMRGGFIPILDVEDGMRRLLDDDLYRRLYPRGREVLDFGLYYKALQRYATFIDSGRMLLLLHEDMAGEPLTTLQTVYRFIDVDADYSPTTLNQRPQRIPYHRTRLQLGRVRNRVITRFNSDKTRAERRRLSPPRYAVAGALTVIDNLLERVLDNEKPRLSEDLHARLADFYRNDTEQLSRLIGRDLRHWLQPDAGSLR
jgi:hypothetical protein